MHYTITFAHPKGESMLCRVERAVRGGACSVGRSMRCGAEHALRGRAFHEGWSLPVSLALSRLVQEDSEFESHLNCMVRTSPQGEGANLLGKDHFF